MAGSHETVERFLLDGSPRLPHPPSPRKGWWAAVKV